MGIRQYPKAAVQSGASSSRGPDLGNPMLNPASVFLPLAGSTQEDLALFQDAAGLLNQQAAEIGLMDTWRDTQYQGTLAAVADSTRHRYNPETPARVAALGLPATEADVAATFPNTVVHFSMDDGRWCSCTDHGRGFFSTEPGSVPSQHAA